MRKLFITVIAMMAMITVAVPVASAATSPLPYTGQGFGTDGAPSTSKCDVGDNGGTGMPIPADGRYLLWVLNGAVTNTTASPPKLTINGTTYTMVKVGSTWKVITPYYSKADLLGTTFVTFTGSANNLVVSHGCARVPSQVRTDIHNAQHGVITSADLGATVHDTATVTSSATLPSGSTVKFTFYKGADVVGTETKAVVNNSVENALPEGPLHAGTYSYKAEFISGNTNLVGNSIAADEPLEINQGELNITTQIHGVNTAHNNVGDAVSVPLGSTVHDTATVAVAAGSYDGFTIPGADDVSFTRNGFDIDKLAAGEAGFTARTVESIALSAGSWTYKAHVNGNSDYKADDSPNEPLTVDKAQLSINTEIHNDTHGGILSALEGSIVHDTATVSGAVPGFDPTGAISFTLNGAAVNSDGMDAGNGAIRSVDSAALVYGTSYTYQAHIASDDNYFAADSPEEPLEVTRNTTGAFCSPGFWKTAPDAAWLKTGHTRTEMFNTSGIVGTFYVSISPDQTLQYVLENNNLYPNAGPFNLTGANAVGAFLANSLDGFHFDPDLVGNEGATGCPLDAHGNYKPGMDPN